MIARAQTDFGPLKHGGVVKPAQRLEAIKARYLHPPHPGTDGWNQTALAQALHDIEFLVGVLNAYEADFVCRECLTGFDSMKALEIHAPCGQWSGHLTAVQ